MGGRMGIVSSVLLAATLLASLLTGGTAAHGLGACSGVLRKALLIQGVRYFF